MVDNEKEKGPERTRVIPPYVSHHSCSKTRATVPECFSATGGAGAGAAAASQASSCAGQQLVGFNQLIICTTTLTVGWVSLLEKPLRGFVC